MRSGLVVGRVAAGEALLVCVAVAGLVDTAGAAELGALRRGPLARFLVMCVSCGPGPAASDEEGPALELCCPEALGLSEDLVLPGAVTVGGPRARIPARAGLNLSARELPPARVDRRDGVVNSFWADAGWETGDCGKFSALGVVVSNFVVSLVGVWLVLREEGEGVGASTLVISVAKELRLDSTEEAAFVVSDDTESRLDRVEDLASWFRLTRPSGSGCSVVAVPGARGVTPVPSS